MTALLEVYHLGVTFTTEDGPVLAVKDTSFTLNRGEILALPVNTARLHNAAHALTLAEDGLRAASETYRGEEIGRERCREAAEGVRRPQ